MQHLKKMQALDNKMTTLSIGVGECIKDMMDDVDKNGCVDGMLERVRMRKLQLLYNELASTFEELLDASLELEEARDARTPFC